MQKRPEKCKKMVVEVPFFANFPLAFSPFLGFNSRMTSSEKARLSNFFDTLDDYLRDGYKSQRPEYDFSDDALPPETSVSPQISGTADIPLQDNPDSLEKIKSEIINCRLCGLCETRSMAVPGEGAENPLVLVVGEGPGADEDRTGRPFVGKAGQLLDKMLASIGLLRDRNCFIANVVKCRPPNNRDPLPVETEACRPYFLRQISVLKPRIILSVGRIPTQTLLDTKEGITKLRGELSSFMGYPFLPTFHPSALLRDENLKRPAWEDLKKLRSALAELDTQYAEESRQGWKP